MTAKRPKRLPGEIVKTTTGCGNLYITVCRVDGKLIELFASLGKAGGCAKAQLEAITRLISVGTRYGMPEEEIIDQLRGIKCPSPGIDDGVQVLSCADAISKILKGEIK